MPICSFCKKEKELKKFFDQMICSDCIKIAEENMDENDLYRIERQYGKKWIKDKLDALVDEKVEVPIIGEIDSKTEKIHYYNSPHIR